jgi:hypothetical protein
MHHLFFGVVKKPSSRIPSPQFTFFGMSASRGSQDDKLAIDEKDKMSFALSCATVKRMIHNSVLYALSGNVKLGSNKINFVKLSDETNGSRIHYDGYGVAMQKFMIDKLSHKMNSLQIVSEKPIRIFFEHKRNQFMVIVHEFLTLFQVFGDKSVAELDVTRTSITDAQINGYWHEFEHWKTSDLRNVKNYNAESIKQGKGAMGENLHCCIGCGKPILK